MKRKASSEKNEPATVEKRDFGVVSVPAVSVGTALASAALGSVALGGSFMYARNRDKRRLLKGVDWTFSAVFSEPEYEMGGMTVQAELDLFHKSLKAMRGVADKTAFVPEVDEYPDDDVILQAIRQGCDTITWKVQSRARTAHKSVRLYVPSIILTDGEVRPPQAPTMADRLRNGLKPYFPALDPAQAELNRVNRVSKWKALSLQHLSNVKTIAEVERVVSALHERVREKMLWRCEVLKKMLENVNSRVGKWEEYIQSIVPENLKIVTDMWGYVDSVEYSGSEPFVSMVQSVLGPDCPFPASSVWRKTTVQEDVVAFLNQCYERAQLEKENGLQLGARIWKGQSSLTYKWKGDDLPTADHRMPVFFLKCADLELMHMLGGCVCEIVREYLPLQVKIDHEVLFSGMPWLWRLIGKLRVTDRCDYRQSLQTALKLSRKSAKDWANANFSIDGDLIFSTDAEGNVSASFDQVTPLAFDKLQKRVERV